MKRKDLRDIVQEAGQLEVPRVEKNLRGIYAVALVAPLVGILGTVSGLIKTFQGMQGRTNISIEGMYEGYYESLVTTGVGLAIAVPCYRVGIEIVNVICDAREGITTHLVSHEEESEKKESNVEKK